MKSEFFEMENLNIYFIVSHPIQYFVPLYKHLATVNGVRSKVLFLSDETLKGVTDKQFGVSFTWDIPLLEGYQYSFIPNRSWKASIFNGFWGLFNPGIISALWRLPKGLVIISGWHFSSYIMGYVFAFLFGHKVAIRCEAPAYKEKDRKGFKNKIRAFLIGKVLLNGIVGKCLYLGEQSKAFYRHFKVKDEKLVFTPYSIDNARFKAGVSMYDKTEERQKLGISSDDFVILFTGKFIPVKRPLDLIQAFEKVQVKNKRLILVGDGFLKEEMVKYIQQHEVEQVHFTGFINQTELPKYYALADVLVLCSESETWGLSVNEAMVCGLPVVVSDRVGCAEDLVHNGENGYIFPKGNIDALANALEKISDSDRRRSMRIQSERIISHYTLEMTSDGIVKAAEQAFNPHLVSTRF